MPKFKETTTPEEVIGIEKHLEIASKGRVLLINRLGGIGDILCTRLIFEDLQQVPGLRHVTFAVPEKFLPLIKDHPFIDQKIAVESLIDVNLRQDYTFIHDLTQVCGQVERRTMPEVTENRVDIMANSFGLQLKSHNGHLTFSNAETNFATRYLAKLGNDPKVVIAPLTAHPSKNLSNSLIQDLIDWCRRKGVIPILMHNDSAMFEHTVIPKNLSLRHWMAIVSKADAVVTAATATFWVSHLTYRPTIAIFGCEDLRVFGKYHLNLVPIQRRAKDKRKPFASITSNQDSVKQNDGTWAYCPCWDARRCALKKWGQYPPLCLESIQLDEITEPLEGLLNPLDPCEMFDARYFLESGHLGWYDGSAWGTLNPFHAEYARFLCDLLNLQPGTSLLDIGAAFGDLVYHLREKGIDAHGVDISEFTVQNKHTLTLKQADVSKELLYATNSFDFVVSRDCLEHIPEKRILQALRNIARVLKPGGFAVLQIATNYCDKELKKRKNPVCLDRTHVCIRDQTWWKWMLKQVGLCQDGHISKQARQHQMVVENCWELFVFRKV